MSETTILAAFRTAIDSVAGIGEVLARPPDGIGALPAAWLTTEGAEVQMGALEVWTWQMKLTVVVSRVGNYAQEQAALEPYRDAVMTAVRSNYTLNGLTFGLNLTTYRYGTVSVGGSDYHGFEMTFSVKEKSSQSLTG